MPSITINFSPEHATRIQDALTYALGLEQPATAADLKAYVIADVRQLVRNTEKRMAEEAASAPIDYVDLT